MDPPVWYCRRCEQGNKGSSCARCHLGLDEPDAAFDRKYKDIMNPNPYHARTSEYNERKIVDFHKMWKAAQKYHREKAKGSHMTPLPPHVTPLPPHITPLPPHVSPEVITIDSSSESSSSESSSTKSSPKKEIPKTVSDKETLKAQKKMDRKEARKKKQTEKKQKSDAYKLKREAAAAKREEADRLFRQKTQTQRREALTKFKSPILTEEDHVIMGHYRDYTRRSPVHVQKDPLDIYIEDKNTQLEELLPISVILTVRMHSRTKEPFIAPLNVVRHIATDFGTCNFSPLENQYRQIMRQGFQANYPHSTYIGEGSLIKEALIKKMTDIRANSKLNEANPAEWHAYAKSKHHTKPKIIKKNMPMFNKLYSLKGPNGLETHETHSIFVRADLPLKELKYDVFFEIRTRKTTLQEILTFLASKGVRNVTLFDTSCQGDEREEIHRTRYGGH